MTTENVLKKHGLTRLLKFKIVLPEILEYIRFVGRNRSIYNDSVYSVSSVTPEILDFLLEQDMIEITEELPDIQYWYVIQYAEYSKPYALRAMTENEFTNSGYNKPGVTILSQIPVE